MTMTMKLITPAVLLAGLLACTLIIEAAAFSKDLCEDTGMKETPTCRYGFEKPYCPDYDIPSMKTGNEELSPGDRNPILLDGEPLEHSCHSTQKVEVWVPGRDEWMDYFYDSNGQRHEMTEVFYVSGSDVHMRTIQPSWQHIKYLLDGRVVRMTVTCNNTVQNCLLFRMHMKKMTPVMV